MRILVLNGAGGDAVAALVQRDGQDVHLVRQEATPRQAGGQGGGSERLAGLLRSLLEQEGWPAGSLGLIAAVTGPGSFTGLRASLSLAHGMALGGSVPLHGVSVPEALRRSVPERHGQPLWCVGLLRRDRVFLQCDAQSGVRACPVEALPSPGQPVLLAGDAAALVAAAIPRATSSGVTRCDPCAVASVAINRLEGWLPPMPALPLYVDPPEARLPAAGLRPQPS